MKATTRPSMPVHSVNGPQCLRIAGTVNPDAVESARFAVRARDSLSRLQTLSRDGASAPAVARALQCLLREGG